MKYLLEIFQQRLAAFLSEKIVLETLLESDVTCGIKVRASSKVTPRIFKVVTPLIWPMRVSQVKRLVWLYKFLTAKTSDLLGAKVALFLSDHCLRVFEMSWSLFLAI